jgi:hypothetical protein
MQPAQSAQPAQKVSALRIGLLFGIILGVVMIAFGVVEQAAKGVGAALSIVGIIVALVAYFFAGFRASGQSGKISTGLLAGMWTGIISSVLNGIASVIVAIPNLPEATAAANKAIVDSGAQTDIRYNETTILLATIGIVVLFSILGSAVALGVGAIGGAAGKGRAPQPQQAYTESLYQSPMAGYPPQQPPQGGAYSGYPPQQQQPQGDYPGYPPQQPPQGGAYPPQQ